MITLAVAQAKSLPDTASNIDTVINLSKNAAKLGCRAVCFPEAFLTGYLPEQAGSVAIKTASPLLSKVSDAAKHFDIDILTGFFERSGDRLFITHGIFCSDGRADFYRKTHLGQKESEIFLPGQSLDIFDLSCGVKIGIQLCVETHFAQITETLSLSGAQVIFAPHAVPDSSGSREAIWKKYIPARSYDNRVYMACCNHSGERFGGGCMVTAPDGEIIVSQFENKPGLITFDVNTELLDRYRRASDSHRFRYYPPMLKKELCR